MLNERNINRLLVEKDTNKGQCSLPDISEFLENKIGTGFSSAREKIRTAKKSI